MHNKKIPVLPGVYQEHILSGNLGPVGAKNIEAGKGAFLKDKHKNESLWSYFTEYNVLKHLKT